MDMVMYNLGSLHIELRSLASNHGRNIWNYKLIISRHLGSYLHISGGSSRLQPCIVRTS